MRGAIVSKRGKSKKAPTAFTHIKNYFLLPVRSGLFGFSSFFVVLIISKYLGYLIGSMGVFKVDLEDVTLSLLGFVLVFLIRFLENFKEEA